MSIKKHVTLWFRHRRLPVSKESEESWLVLGANRVDKKKMPTVQLLEPAGM